MGLHLNRKHLLEMRVFAAALTLFTLWFIFSRSMANADLSNEESGMVLGLIDRICGWLGLEPASVHLVRKVAHFCEFAGLGVSLSLCLWAYLRDYTRNLSLPILGGLLAALTDETIQLSSDGRAGMVQDVWLDFAGVLAGIAGLTLLRMLVRKYGKRSGSHRGHHHRHHSHSSSHSHSDGHSHRSGHSSSHSHSSSQR